MDEETGSMSKKDFAKAMGIGETSVLAAGDMLRVKEGKKPVEKVEERCEAYEVTKVVPLKEVYPETKSETEVIAIRLSNKRFKEITQHAVIADPEYGQQLWDRGVTDFFTQVDWIGSEDVWNNSDKLYRQYCIETGYKPNKLELDRYRNAVGQEISRVLEIETQLRNVGLSPEERNIVRDKLEKTRRVLPMDMEQRTLVAEDVVREFKGKVDGAKLSVAVDNILVKAADHDVARTQQELRNAQRATGKTVHDVEGWDEQLDIDRRAYNTMAEEVNQGVRQPIAIRENLNAIHEIDLKKVNSIPEGRRTSAVPSISDPEVVVGYALTDAEMEQFNQEENMAHEKATGAKEQHPLGRAKPGETLRYIAAFTEYRNENLGEVLSPDGFAEYAKRNGLDANTARSNYFKLEDSYNEAELRRYEEAKRKTEGELNKVRDAERVATGGDNGGRKDKPLESSKPPGNGDSNKDASQKSQDQKDAKLAEEKIAAAKETGKKFFETESGKTVLGMLGMFTLDEGAEFLEKIVKKFGSRTDVDMNEAMLEFRNLRKEIMQMRKEKRVPTADVPGFDEPVSRVRDKETIPAKDWGEKWEEVKQTILVATEIDNAPGTTPRDVADSLGEARKSRTEMIAEAKSAGVPGEIKEEFRQRMENLTRRMNSQLRDAAYSGMLIDDPLEEFVRLIEDFRMHSLKPNQERYRPVLSDWLDVNMAVWMREYYQVRNRNGDKERADEQNKIIRTLGWGGRHPQTDLLIERMVSEAVKLDKKLGGAEEVVSADPRAPDVSGVVDLTKIRKFEVDPQSVVQIADAAFVRRWGLPKEFAWLDSNSHPLYKYDMVDALNLVYSGSTLEAKQVRGKDYSGRSELYAMNLDAKGQAFRAYGLPLVSWVLAQPGTFDGQFESLTNAEVSLYGLAQLLKKDKELFRATQIFLQADSLSRGDKKGVNLADISPKDKDFVDDGSGSRVGMSIRQQRDRLMKMDHLLVFSNSEEIKNGMMDMSRDVAYHLNCDVLTARLGLAIAQILDAGPAMADQRKLLNKFHNNDWLSDSISSENAMGPFLGRIWEKNLPPEVTGGSTKVRTLLEVVNEKGLKGLVDLIDNNSDPVTTNYKRACSGMKTVIEALGNISTWLEGKDDAVARMSAEQIREKCDEELNKTAKHPELLTAATRARILETIDEKGVNDGKDYEKTKEKKIAKLEDHIEAKYGWKDPMASFWGIVDGFLGTDFGENKYGRKKKS